MAFNINAEEIRRAEDLLDEPNEVDRIRSQNNKRGVLVHTPSDVEHCLNSAIKQVEEVTGKSTTESRLLLEKHMWDINEVPNQWSLTETESLPPSLPSHNNDRYCSICCKTTAVEFESLRCNHKFCNSCWVDYMGMKVISGASKIECPYYGCSAIAEDEFILERMSNPLKAIYKRSILENYVYTKPSVFHCPSQTCEYIIELSQPQTETITCLCGYEICPSCFLSSHQIVNCNLHRKWSTSIRGMFHPSVKCCPGCNVPLEKSGGCDHITCSECQHEFCWICLNTWLPLHSCTIMAASSTIMAASSTIMAASSISLQPPSMGHYDQFKYFCKKTKLQLERCRVENDVRRHTDDMNMRDFLKDLVHCRQTLMSSYEFLFFLVDSENKTCFKDNHDLLEKETERLSEMLTEELSTEYITSVLQQSLSCLAVRANLIKQAEEGYKESYWKFKEVDFDKLRLSP